jgi:hypothetical protein
MRRFLRVTALVVAVAAFSFWLAKGAHRGWSKTSVPVKKTDPITEIAYQDYEQRFVPGLDFLLAGVLCSVGVSLASFVGRRGAVRPFPSS